MSKATYDCLLVSDFNVENLHAQLSHDAELPAVRSTVAPFGQVFPTLLGLDACPAQQRFDLAVIWTRPEGVLESLASALRYERPAIEQVLAEVDEFSAAIQAFRDRVSFSLVCNWALPSWERGYGPIDWRSQGVAHLLARANLRLAENLEPLTNCFVLNTQKWLDPSGTSAFNPKLWYLAKVPFGGEVFKTATTEIKAAIRAVAGQSRKLIALDLDDTLWGGIVGEVGWENLRLGGHDPLGEAYLDFQKALKGLSNRGILLALLSKNEEATALEAIRKHPEMALRLDDFAGWRINWNDKAANLAELAEELNLGLESIVFIDDNPSERGRVREALPAVLVPDWPAEKMLYRKALLSLRCFDAPTISYEDTRRTEMYVSERQRRDLKKSVGTPEQWLRSLQIRVTIEPLNEGNLQRTVQLINKTNQMNLSTRRLTHTELLAWLSVANRSLWCFTVCDKFGDSGLTGITSVEFDGSRGRIVDFILSCRVLGRKIENLMLHKAVHCALHAGVEQLEARHLPTPRNQVCLDFWKSSGFPYDPQADVFRWNANTPYPAPDFISFEIVDPAASRETPQNTLGAAANATHRSVSL